MSIYRAVSFDKLHANDLGLFGKHLWEQFLLAVDNATRDIRGRIDEA